MEVAIRTLVTSLILQVMFFSVAASYKTDKLTDLSYGLTFIVISILLIVTNTTPSMAQVALSAMVIVWGLRLAIYLFIRILKTKKDDRFDGIRENPLKFARFWFLQALSVFIIMLPATYAVSSKLEVNLGIYTILGFLIWLKGFTIEAVADWQKYKFKEKSKGGFITSGVWKYSRHPNYFGEMALWWGIFVFSIPYLRGFMWLSILGPIYITYLLIFVTGIPMLEKSYSKRFGKDKKYLSYKRKTSILIPFFPKH